MAEGYQTVDVTITLHRRHDGGLRVHSETLPGLILSGTDQDAVAEYIGPAIKALLEHRKEWPAVPSVEAEAEYARERFGG